MLCVCLPLPLYPSRLVLADSPAALECALLCGVWSLVNSPASSSCAAQSLISPQPLVDLKCKNCHQLLLFANGLGAKGKVDCAQQ
jgi:hypothetical protein